MDALMSSQPKISIILPVYNAEKTLGRVVECIRRQTLEDYEVISVDDGSTDNSFEIVKAVSDPRFQVYRQANAGAGAARNKGTEQASGKYIFYCDADDYFEDNLLQVCFDEAEDTRADIVVFDFVREYVGEVRERVPGINRKLLPGQSRVFDRSSCPERILSVLYPSPWCKLYRASFIREFQLKFDEIAVSNDISFSAVGACLAEKITYIENPLYTHRIGHEGTITTRKSRELGDIAKAVQSTGEQIEKMGYAIELAASYRYFAVDQYIANLYKFGDLSSPVTEAYYNEIRKAFLSHNPGNVDRDLLSDDRLYDRFTAVLQNEFSSFKNIVLRDEISGIDVKRIEQKIKNQLSYRIGQVILQNVHPFYRIFAIPFLLYRAYREFRKHRDDG